MEADKERDDAGRQCIDALVQKSSSQAPGVLVFGATNALARVMATLDDVGCVLCRSASTIDAEAGGAGIRVWKSICTPLIDWQKIALQEAIVVTVASVLKDFVTALDRISWGWSYRMVISFTLAPSPHGEVVTLTELNTAILRMEAKSTARGPNEIPGRVRF